MFLLYEIISSTLSEFEKVEITNICSFNSKEKNLKNKIFELENDFEKIFSSCSEKIQKKKKDCQNVYKFFKFNYGIKIFKFVSFPANKFKEENSK